MRVLSVPAILIIGIATACSGTGDTAPVTVVRYTVTLTTGPGSIASVGTSVPVTFVAIEHESDSTSKPASGKSFTVTVTSGGGTINGAASAALTTGTDGSASFTWVLGTVPSTQVVRGSVSSAEFLDITVSAVAGPAAQLAITTQPSQTGQGGVALPVQPIIQVEDAFGNPVRQAGVPVTASIAPAGGTIGGTATVSSDAAGVVTFSNLSLSGIVGTATLRFAATLSGHATTVTSAGVGTVWTAKAAMPTPRSDFAIGEVNGIIYAVGGFNGNTLGTVEAYNPVTNSWTTKAPMPTPRSGLAVGVVNGILYAVGGIGTPGTLATVEAYDPVANSWTTRASMPTPRNALSVGVANGVLYAVGGTSNATFFATVEAYDPVANSWTAKASMPTIRDGFAIGVVDGVLYAVGGFNGTTTLAAVEAYTPGTNTWTTRASLPAARDGISIGVVNGLLQVVGGSGPANSFEGSVDTYDPVANSWLTAGPTLTPRADFAIGVVNGILYAVGGTTAASFIGTVEASTP